MTRVSDIGEWSLIERIMKHLTRMPDMPLPFWDDASALDLGDERAIVINTDMLVWETDVPVGMTPYQAGRKAVVMNVSDLGAKGVEPLAFMPNIGLPVDYPVDNVVDIAKGLETGAREYGCYVIGGDTNEACDVIISGLAIGIVEKTRILKRAGGMRGGDVLATTGTFGLTSAGFKHLIEGYNLPGEISEPILESIYMPRAQVKEGVVLSETGAITGCMDSSDGLALSLYDLQRSTGFGFKVKKLPLDPVAEKFAKHNNLDPALLVLHGGEEYHLVFTFHPLKEKKIRSALKKIGSEPLIIGEVTENKQIAYRKDGMDIHILPKGWEHFKD